MVPGTLSKRNVNRYRLIPAASSVMRTVPRAQPLRALEVEDFVIEEAATSDSSDDHEDDECEQLDLIHPQSDHFVDHLLS
jgi:hypothetical protein